MDEIESRVGGEEEEEEVAQSGGNAHNALRLSPDFRLCSPFTQRRQTDGSELFFQRITLCHPPISLHPFQHHVP